MAHPWTIRYLNMHNMSIKPVSQKKIAIIGTVGLPANYGGFETLTEHLIEDLGQKHAITVYCSGKKYPASERKATYKGAKLKYIPLDANGIQSIPYDTLSILHALFFADVLLILGVAGAWVLPFVRWFTNKKIIISIDGIEWKRDKWNWLAKWYLFWAESLAVKYSHIDISDNEAIQDYTAARYGTLSRIIEYGADHTLKVRITNQATEKYPFLKLPYAFKVCRIEPENNVHLILEAFVFTQKMPLVIVGNWAKSEYGRALKDQYSEQPGIHILDPIYDQQQLDLLRSNAALYVHGHSAGGTNPSLVEAMYLGLPILAYGVSYNKVTTEDNALYFNDLNSLIAEINTIYTVRLKSIGVEMEKIAKRRYKWSNIAAKYDLLVEEALQVNKKSEVGALTQKLPYEQLIATGHAHLKINHIL
jgi:glycosyltransferase involved in cell wall biosynthesis